MAGPNITGTPETDDYNLGRGIVFFALLDANDMPKGYRDLGNAPEFNISIETETLEHASSRAGLKVIDKEIVISQKVSLSLTLDELNHENLALQFSGAKAVHTNVAIAGFTIRTLIPAADLVQGQWYDLRNTAGERAYDVLVGNLTLATTNGAPVTLVEGTDYTLNSQMGRVFIKDSTVTDTAIANVEGITATLTARAGANVVNEVQALTTTTVSGALKFIAENPADADRQTEYQFHKVSLKGEGDLSLIGDEVTTLTLSGVAERSVLADSASPTLTVRTVTLPLG